MKNFTRAFSLIFRRPLAHSSPAFHGGDAVGGGCTCGIEPLFGKEWWRRWCVCLVVNGVLEGNCSEKSCFEVSESGVNMVVLMGLDFNNSTMVWDFDVFYLLSR